MELIPFDIIEKLELDKILQWIEKECLGEPGKQVVRKIRPRTEIFIIDRLLKEVKEFQMSFEEIPVPISNYVDVSEQLKLLEIEGMVLPIDQIVAVKNQLVVMSELFQFFSVENQKIYPTLYDILREDTFDMKVILGIEKIIDDEGRIKRTASPELMKIHKAMVSKRRELDKQFADTIQNYRKKGWLTDSIESFRNGRRVLSVPAEHKRKIKGIIHDESATGKTAFLEPENIIGINNDIFNLENEERREVHKILKDLCAMLRPYVPIMRKYQSLIIRFDVIRAKAKLAVVLDADMPRLKDRPQFHFMKSYHPLLLLKNKSEAKKTIPFDLVLHGKNRILVLSGPNAGGKSVSMKAAGLLQMMVQSGILVPSDPESEYGIFHSFFADIGDQQSLEDDLSTYSSRLKNMKMFMKNANSKTLVLIDEFGSGTDPQIGGAIAESILKDLHDKKVFAFITTHYSNLKVFAFKTKGIVNAAMRFDKDTLSPTYELQIGSPGSSYAFEIAKKIGLGTEVIKYAKKKIGKNERAIDQLLIDLQKEKQELEEKLAAAQSRQKSLDTLIKNYEKMSGDLEVSRKKLKLDAKELEIQRSAQDNKILEKLVREIKEEKNLEKAKKLAADAREKRKKNSELVHGLKEDIYHKESKKQKRAIIVGDFVKLKSGGSTGTVIRIDKKTVIIEMGLLKITAKMRDLELVGEPLEFKKKGINSNLVEKKSQFVSKLDVRGMRRDDALITLERYMDNALVSGVSKLEIIHGKGDGILRQAVHQKLREYSDIKEFYHPEPQQGGDGATWVTME